MSQHPLKHLAIIMDGNNRWARREGKQGIAGHRAGVERIRDVLNACREHKIEVLTVFAFSSENWRRPPKEVEALMGLFYTYLKKEAGKLSKEGVRLKVIGNRSRFDSKLVAAIEEAEAIACEGSATLVIAADYGGCWDIAQAAQQASEDLRSGKASSMDEELLASHLTTRDLPPLDLLIRTGGEYRISNFLIWQAAYAELFFSEKLWPEFDGAALKEAVDAYYNRQRRFGKTGEQVQQEAARA